MNNKKITILAEQFENGNNGEMVDALTLIIDGQLKDMFDIIISREDGIDSYSEVLKEVLFTGIEAYVEKYRK